MAESQTTIAKDASIAKCATGCHPATGTDTASDNDPAKPQMEKKIESTSDRSKEKEKENSDSDDDDNENDIILETIPSGGIYSLTREVRFRPHKKFNLYNVIVPFEGLYAAYKKRIELIPYSYRFFMECFRTSPVLMGVFFLMKLWTSLRSAIAMFLTERLMKIIQAGITTHNIDGRALFGILFLRLLSIALESFVSSKSEQLRHTLGRKIRYVILGRMIKTNVTFDLPGYEGSEYITNMSHYYAQYPWCDDVWDQFERIIEICSGITGVFSQLSFLYYLLRTQPGGIWFVIVSAIQPLSQRKFLNVSRLASIAWNSNLSHQRIQTILRLLHRTEHRVEIISLGLKDYILNEWKAAVEGLGHTSEFLPSPEHPTPTDESKFRELFQSNVISHLPMMFYSYQVYLDPKAFSLSSIALVDQATMMIDQVLENILGARHGSPVDFEWMKSLYVGVPDSRVLPEGETVYSSSDGESTNGMEIKLENVSYSYDKDKEPVLKDISFTIKKGQTVVIVGANGSGKSTLLKLINRIYDVSSGTIYVDGKPFKSYVASSVQQAMAILFQKFSHFPVSFAENIFLGCFDYPISGNESDTHLLNINHEKTREAIKEAAERGGSTELIDKQSKGMDTVVRPVIWTEWNNYDAASQKMKDFVKELHNNGADMSLGQWQRLALARLFYRAAMKRTKLVAADEPSASLDPQIEYQIFSRLYSLSAELGKTLIYVTHRFGYLTKRADLILVMKDGKLVEQGRHVDLLALNGEYAKLYTVQAEAFLSDPKESTPSTPERETLCISGNEES